MGGNIRDFEGNIKHTQVLDPAAVTADATSASVDMKDYGSVAFYALVGESGDTIDASNFIEIEVQVSDDDSTFSAAADLEITHADKAGTNAGTFAKINAATEDDAVYMTQYRGGSRYVRVVVNVTGTHSNGTPIGIMAVQSKAYDLGVS